MHAETQNSIEKTMTTQEQIDRYLAGQMTEEEKLQFERLLSADDSSLRDEMELQKEIILAIRRRALKEMLQEEEERLSKEKEEEHHRKVRIWTIRSVASLAVAACFVGVILVGPQMSRLNNLSQQDALYAEALTEITDAYSQLKGCNDATDAILEANALMQAGDYKQADAILVDALSEMGDVQRESLQAWSEKEDMLYLRALCAIKQHKLYRSRRLLNEVITMDSTHKAEAQQLLNTIKHGK